MELIVEPIITILDVGTSQHYKAWAIDSDGAVSDVSSEVSWSLENDSAIVQFDPTDSSLALAIAAGTDNVVA
ncbi:hypothetical protein, partial [Kaarinaea lacus]